MKESSVLWIIIFPVCKIKLHLQTDLGNWRSWLARYTGSVEVTGSNPVFSTKNPIIRQLMIGFFH